jgi:hypothetical protein
MTLDRNRKQREPQIDSDQHRFFMDHSLELNSALIPVNLEGRAEDVMRDRVLPLVLAGISFICVHLVNLWFGSAFIRSGSHLMGATGRYGQKIKWNSAGLMSPWSPWTHPRQSKAVRSSPKQSKVNEKDFKYCRFLTMSSMESGLDSTLIRPESDLVGAAGS